MKDVAYILKASATQLLTEKSALVKLVDGHSSVHQLQNFFPKTKEFDLNKSREVFSTTTIICKLTFCLLLWVEKLN